MKSNFNGLIPLTTQIECFTTNSINATTNVSLILQYIFNLLSESKLKTTKNQFHS
jgi:hypothetical protein